MNLKNIFHFEEKHKKQLLSFISEVTQVLAFFTLAFIIFYFKCSFSWSIFSERDISRADSWLKGDFYWLGPEMSGGNNLPGPFFYFLLFPSFLLGDNIHNQVALWTITWFALTYTAAYLFISKITAHKESNLFFLITFILGKLPISSDVLNPEFAVMFHVLALIMLYYWREKRNNIYLYLTGLIVALGVQAHLLVALYIPTALIFYIIDKLKNIKAFLLFLLVAGSPMLIYFLLKSFQVFDTSATEAIPHTSFLLENIFSETWFIYVQRYIIPFTPFFTFCFILTLWSKYKTQKRVLKPAVKNLLIIITIPFLAGLLGAQHFWYLLFIPVFSVILISKWLDDLIPDNSNKKINFLLVYILFALMYSLISSYKDISFFLNSFSLSFAKNKFALLIFFFTFFIILTANLRWCKEASHKFILLCFVLFMSAQVSAFYIFSPADLLSSVSSSIPWPTYKTLTPLMKRIYLDTGWTPKMAMKKMTVIGIHPERSLLSDYTRTVEKLNPPPPPPLGKAEGYFIILDSQQFADWKQKNWNSYLSQSSLLSPALKQEIKNNKITIQRAKLYNSYWLIPYKTKENSFFTNGFHNIGQPYYWEEPDWLKKCNQTQILKNEKGFFYCRVWPEYLQKAGLGIQFSKNIKTSFLNIQFFGPLLASPNLSVNLYGIAKWSDIQIYLECNKKLLHWNLPDVGTHHDSDEYIENQKKMLLAPLKIKIPLKECAKDNITNIKLTFTEKHSERGQKKEHIAWELN